MLEQLGLGARKLILDNRLGGSTILVSPPIPVRIEWADSQGNVTASWLAAHFDFCSFPEQSSGRARAEAGRRSLEDPVHADVGIHDGIDFVMVRAGVHDQNLGSSWAFLTM